jgi:hypothetical protein
MSTEFYKVNSKLSTSQKIELLNDMIIALAGKIASAQFNLNEIEALYTDLGSSYQRKYLRNVSLGHDFADYTDWTHVHAESGYSIWKIAPDNYAYDTDNNLYLDDKVLSNQGEANSETATSFDTVYVYDGATYNDNTTEAGTEAGTEFDLMAETDEFLYVGEASTFTGIKFEFKDRGANYTLVAEYWNGSAWIDLDSSGLTYSDNTSNFESDGLISFSAPGDWATTTVNGVSKYWVRISTTTTPVTVATAYLIIPGDSVIGKLALSSTEFFNEDWKWCSYNDSIYVTIRNTGNSAYEGDYYITSSSSSTNLQNYFVANHQFTADHLDSTY